MNIPLFLVLLFALQAVCWAVGRKSAKSIKTQEDYFLAGKQLRFFPLLMTFVATQVGGGLILGAAEEAYQYGWVVILYPIGATLGLLALASGIGKRMAQYNVSTVAELFEILFNSRNLKRFASILSIVSLFLIFIAQLLASRKFLVSIGVDDLSIFLGFWAIVIVYTAIGGMQAVVATDIIQAVFFIGAFVMAAAYTFFYYPEQSSQTVSAFSDSSFSMEGAKLCGWLLMPLLFIIIGQDMAQRCFSADRPRTVTKAAGWAAALTLSVCVIPVFFGILAKQMGVQITGESSVLMSVIRLTTNPTLTAVVACATVAAIISTADSLINAICSNLSQDFSYLKRQSERSLLVTQALTVFIAGVGIACSFYFVNIVDLLILSYELSVCCLCVPLLWALWSGKGDKQAAILAVAGGAIGFCVFRWVDVMLPREVLSLGCSALGYAVGVFVLSRKSMRVRVGT